MAISNRKKAVVSVMLVIFLIFSSIVPSAYAAQEDNIQTTADNSKKKTIWLIATHCDDEANVGYSIVRDNVLAGNDVYVTNHSTSGIRGGEAIEAMGILGLPSENYLVSGVCVKDINSGGYYALPDRDTAPDGLKTGGLTVSKTGVYYPSWPSLHMGGEQSGSINSTVNIFANIITTLRPDEIYCIDQDNNYGHRTTSYLIEDAVCKVLRENEDGYVPRVYKGFSYVTAWTAKRDFYSYSPDDSTRYYLKSTLLPSRSQDGYVWGGQQMSPYKWSERVRFPMPEGLQTADEENLIFDVMSCYKSQNLEEDGAVKAECVANADKVFWERDTRGISYKADVSVSSNESIKERAVDFHLNDRRKDDGTGDVAADYANYTWKPAEEDSEKIISLSWDTQQDIEKITLYDDQYLDRQITSGVLTFYQGEEAVHTETVGALENGGDGTDIVLEKSVQADKVRFQILAGEGDYGLSEFEVYTSDTENRETEFIKIQLANDTEDFLYTYPVRLNGEEKRIPLSVYRYPDEIAGQGYEWSVPDNAGGKLAVKDGVVTLHGNTPSGEYEVKVKDTATGLTDSIILSVVNDPTVVTAPTLNIADGSIVMTDEGFRQGSEGLVKWGDEEHTLTISGTFDGTAEGVTEARMIDIQGGNPEISLKDLTLKQNKSSDNQHAAYMMPAVLLAAGETAKLSVYGSSTLEGGCQAPAVQINKDAELSIEGQKKGTDTLTVKGGDSNYTAIGAGNTATPYAASNEATGGNLTLKNLSVFAYAAGSSDIGDSDAAFGNITVENIILRCYGSVAGAIKTGGKFTASESSLYVSNGIYAEGGYEDDGTNSFLGTGGSTPYKISQITEGEGRIDTWLCKREARAVSASAEATKGSHLASLTATYNDGTADTQLTIKNGSFTMPAYPVTVKAVFEKNRYTVAYDANGGTGETAASSHTYDTGKALTANGFTRSGYTFTGWNTEADGTGTAYANQASVKNLSEGNGAAITLYAQWKANKYTATYMNGDVTFDSKEVTYDGKYVLPEATPEKTGEIFKGWFTAAEGGQQVTAATTVKTAANHNLYAQWTDKQAVTINTAAQTYTYGDADIAFAVKDAATDGFTVEYLIGDEWTTEAPVNVGSYDVKVTRAEDATYASFSKVIESGLVIKKAAVTAAAVTVTAPVATKTPATTATVADATYTVKSVSWTPADAAFGYDTAYTVSVVLEADANHVFSASPTAKVNGSTATAKLTDNILTVAYTFAKTEKEIHTITFMNGGTKVAEKKVTDGEALTDIPAVPAKTGYTGAWDKTDFTNIKASATVKTVYTANAYSVKYDANGGAGTTTASSHTYDTEKALTKNGFAKDGYTFNGWNTRADGTGTAYADKAEVKNLTAKDGAEVKLYAQWKVVSYTITYGGVAGAVNSNPASYTVESAAITLTAPTKAGYVFTGWTYAGQTTPVKTVVIPKGSMGNKAYTANFMMIPTAPAKVTTALYGYDDIKVTWSAATGATSYQVYMKKGSGAYTLATTTSSLSYKAKNLADGAKYTFKVVAYNGTLAGGEKASSAIYTLKKVTGVKVVKSGSKVKVSWKNIEGETGYQISKMTKKKGTQKKPTTYKTTKGKYKKLAATKGKTYYYKVRAYKQVGKTKIYGPWSAVKKFKRK